MTANPSVDPLTAEFGGFLSHSDNKWPTPARPPLGAPLFGMLEASG
jgi:hypothetical protein